MIFKFDSPEQFSHHIDKHPEWKDRFSVADAARQIDIQENEVLELIGSGQLNAASVLQKLGDQCEKRIYVTSKDVARWIENKKIYDQIDETAVGWLLSRSQYLQPFLLQSERPSRRTDEGYITVEQLIKDLNEREERKELLAEPELKNVEGMFLMANLLTTGLWKRDQAIFGGLERLSDPIQRWLAVGFSEWAPSIDINPEIETLLKADSSYPYLVAQLGTRDEAFSLPLLISKEKKEVIATIAEMQKKHKAFLVNVVGKIYHKDHLPEDEKTLLGQYSYNYCLKIEDDEDRHQLTPKNGNDNYSGYLWVCLADTSDTETKPKFSDTYYVWEHADLSNPKTIDYAKSALQRKIEYINKHINPKLTVYIKSMPFACDQKPDLSSKNFYDRLMAKGSGLA